MLDDRRRRGFNGSVARGDRLRDRELDAHPPFDLWTIRDDGTGLTRLHVRAAGLELAYPKWSPDGRQILVTIASKRTGAEIAIVSVDEPMPKLRARVHVSPEPQWSPDGRWIAFARRIGPHDWRVRVYVMHPDGTGLHGVTPPARHYSWIAWAPDSMRLVIEGDDFNCREHLWVTSLHGGARLLRTCGWEPTWSHDGRFIIMSERTGVGDRLLMIRPDGSGARQLTHGRLGHYDWFPAVSPDGRRLVFLRQGRFRKDLNARWLVTLDLQTLRETVITPRWSGASLQTQRELSWSSDGAAVLFSRVDHPGPAPPPGCSLWRVNSDDGGLRRLFTGTTCAADWKPAA